MRRHPLRGCGYAAPGNADGIRARTAIAGHSAVQQRQLLPGMRARSSAPSPSMRPRGSGSSRHRRTCDLAAAITKHAATLLPVISLTTVISGSVFYCSGRVFADPSPSVFLFYTSEWLLRTPDLPDLVFLFFIFAGYNRNPLRSVIFDRQDGQICAFPLTTVVSESIPAASPRLAKPPFRSNHVETKRATPVTARQLPRTSSQDGRMSQPLL